MTYCFLAPLDGISGTSPTAGRLVHCQSLGKGRAPGWVPLRPAAAGVSPGGCAGVAGVAGGWVATEWPPPTPGCPKRWCRSCSAQHDNFVRPRPFRDWLLYVKGCQTEESCLPSLSSPLPVQPVPLCLRSKPFNLQALISACIESISLSESTLS